MVRNIFLRDCIGNERFTDAFGRSWEKNVQKFEEIFLVFGKFTRLEGGGFLC